MTGDAFDIDGPDEEPLTYASFVEMYLAELANAMDQRIEFEFGGALYSTGPAEP